MQRNLNKMISALNMLKPISMTILSAIFLGLIACSSSYRFMPSNHQLPAHLPQADPVKLRLLQKLYQDNIQVIQQGQYILISIPSVLLFPRHSPNIIWPGYQYLNDVACYIKSFRKVEMTINSYDTCCDKHQRILALTLARASNVAEYLISQGVDTRILFTRGMGNDKPIRSGVDLDPYLTNSRIEIMFKEEII
jgi:intracellular multiplication protein IcmN